jgi:hypothetical protein
MLAMKFLTTTKLTSYTFGNVIFSKCIQLNTNFIANIDHFIQCTVFYKLAGERKTTNFGRNCQVQSIN